MKIKKAKILKVFMFSSMIATTFASGALIASCGKSKTPPPNKFNWADFKKSALAESAAHLRDSISVSELTTFHWTSKDVADWGANEQPTVVSGKQEITATIIIQGASTFQNFPINFDVTYDPTGYDVKDWTYTQNPNVVSWKNFKGLAAIIDAPSLFDLAQKFPGYGDWGWKYGTDAQRKWDATKDIAEWDVYGGANDKDAAGGIDLMHGDMHVDDDAKTLTAIISRKGHEGIYDANPIKATIAYKDSAKIYNPKNWVFSQAKQLQSQAKYQELFLAEDAVVHNLDTTKQGSTLQPWIDFGNRNWSNVFHSVTVKATFESKNKEGTDTYNMVYNKNENISSATEILFNLWINVPLKTTHKNQNLIMTSTFTFEDASHPQIGNCFNNVWAVDFEA